MRFAPTAIISLSGQSGPLPRGSSVISHIGISPPLLVLVLRPSSALTLSPLHQPTAPRAEAFTLSSSGSPIVPTLVAEPNPALPVLGSFVFPASIDSIVLATLTQQVRCLSRLAQEMQALAQAM